MTMHVCVIITIIVILVFMYSVHKLYIDNALYFAAQNYILGGNYKTAIIRSQDSLKIFNFCLSVNFQDKISFIYVYKINNLPPCSLFTKCLHTKKKKISSKLQMVYTHVVIFIFFECRMVVCRVWAFMHFKISQYSI